MERPIIYYCYDAYCGWCYGFSSVMKNIAAEYKDTISFEVLSGGMIPEENARPVSAIASYVSKAYLRVEELTGVKFGQDFLWHMFNPDKSDWYPHSENAAAALCIFKEHFPDRQVEIAADLQYALNFEGRDLTDDEAYRHLLEKYKLDADDFYKKLKSEEYRDKARYEFSLCRQLQVNGFPAVLMQTAEEKFYLIVKGYTPENEVKERIERVLAESKSEK